MAIPIYIIGSSNTDMVVKCDRLPATGETIIGGQFFMNAGGKGANQAVAAARLGGNVTLVARVGNDLFGQQAIDQFKKENISTGFISIDERKPSGVALITVDAHGENCIAVAPGANNEIVPETLTTFFSSIQKPAFVLVQLEIPPKTVAFIVEQCALQNIPVVLNPAPANFIPDKTLAKLFAITPNETETRMLTGIATDSDEAIALAAQNLHAKGVKKVIITLGKRGAYWSDGIHAGFISAPPVQAIDSTAAGDCFNGALVVALANGSNLEDSIDFACRAASISVTRLGAQASMPYRHELTP
jgi:ribokinase